ncbi:hypothetical protein CEXT_15661 [Caerostris extrusa]|uniref:Uncharacterized protein n=1 Tax=Caerostris extrusa TaxID=172846 RepID=A0AAV4MCH8_CAEEX|nr:hypothetical protein CEXT_15661 [Caerostris extrusa]
MAGFQLATIVCWLSNWIKFHLLSTEETYCLLLAISIKCGEWAMMSWGGSAEKPRRNVMKEIGLKLLPIKGADRTRRHLSRLSDTSNPSLLEQKGTH